MVKNPPPSAGDIRDLGSIPGPGRSPGGGHGNPLQCSCLENPMDRGAWRVMVHGVTKSWTRLKRLSTHAGESFRFWETVCDKGKGKHHRLKLAEFFFFFSERGRRTEVVPNLLWSTLTCWHFHSCY